MGPKKMGGIAPRDPHMFLKAFRFNTIGETEVGNSIGELRPEKRLDFFLGGECLLVVKFLFFLSKEALQTNVKYNDCEVFG